MEIAVESYRSSDTASKAALLYLNDQHNWSSVLVNCSDDEWSIRHSEGVEIDSKSVLSFVLRKVKSQNSDARIVFTSTLMDQTSGNEKLSAVYKSAIVVPVVREDNSLKGILCAFSKTDEFNKSDTDNSKIVILANMIGSLLHCEQSLLSMTAMASMFRKGADTDTLTGLLSRAGWYRILESEQKRIVRYVEYRVAVFLIDLDDLKIVNDTKGHSAGDHLLQRCAASILSVIRESDYAARFGGDEFTLLILECNDEGASELYNRLRTAFRENNINASIGYATVEEDRNLRTALKQADDRMYRDKIARKLDSNNLESTTRR